MCLTGHCAACSPPQKQDLFRDIRRHTGNWRSTSKFLTCMLWLQEIHFRFSWKKSISSSEQGMQDTQLLVLAIFISKWRLIISLAPSEGPPNSIMSKPGQEVFPPFDFLSSRTEVPASTFHLLHPIFIPGRCTLRNSLKTKIKNFGAKAQNW